MKDLLFYYRYDKKKLVSLICLILDICFIFCICIFDIIELLLTKNNAAKLSSCFLILNILLAVGILLIVLYYVLIAIFKKRKNK